MEPSTKSLAKRLEESQRAIERLRAEVETLAARVRELEAKRAMPAVLEIDGGGA